MSREVCGICWCPYDEAGKCGCPSANIQKSTLSSVAQEESLNINYKEPQPGMVNLDAFHAFHFNDPPKGGFVGEMEMVKWLVRNRDGDYWKAKHGIAQDPPCATQECMPSQCPNCASLEAQNTELDRKLADLEQTSLELCETCGWRAMIPGDCCLNCTRRRLTDAEIGEVWFAAKIPGLTETQARLLIRAAERRLAEKKLTERR